MKLTAATSLLMLVLGLAKGQTVLLDSYFNNESRVDANGKKESWHYKWDETDNGGFSLLADVFKKHAVQTRTSFERPSRKILKQADIYIIVDPDVPKENPKPNYIEAADVQNISDWVRNGGVLVLMNNDTGNAEFDHLNTLAEKFGIRFNKDSRNPVEDHHFETGGLVIPADNTVFKTARKIYMKDICTLEVTNPAGVILKDKGDVIIAVSKFGRGTVFGVGDPWLYNEYTDGKILPKEFQNLDAANDLVQWLVEQIPKKYK